MFKNENIEKINSQRIDWEENVLSNFIKKGLIKDNFETPSGIVTKNIYGPEDIENINFTEDIGFPGTSPFTRGVYPTMYRGRLWTMRQYAGFGNAIQTNKRFKYLISKGQKGLSIAFDLPTQMGYDPDNPLCQGEIGKVGVSINSLKDFEQVFDGIPLDKVSTSMTINAPAAILLAMYVAVGEKQGVKPENLTGTVQNDILKEYVARGTYIFPPRQALRLTSDMIEYSSNFLPRFNSISVCGYHMREAGSNAIQEVAFTLANGLTYVSEVLKRGIDIDDFAPRLSFFFSINSHFFEEIAKLRAARRLWARLMKEKFNPKNPNSLRLRFHSQTAGVTLVAQQPDVNIIRVAIQALASILGGTQSLHTGGYDEALCIPTKDSARLSLRTQQVLAHETGVSDVVDPLGGSYYIEALTNKIEEEAKKYIDIIDSMGGMVSAIEKGYIQRQIEENAYNLQKKMDAGEDKKVGLNCFCSEEELKIARFKHDKDTEKKAMDSLLELQKIRDGNVVRAKLEELKKIAQSSENIMPIMIEVVKSYATIQEICDVLRDVLGVCHNFQCV